jgi:hypothetical protein
MIFIELSPFTRDVRELLTDESYLSAAAKKTLRALNESW